MRLLHEIGIFQTVESKVILSLFETARLSVSISLRNLYNSLNSIKERQFKVNYHQIFSYSKGENLRHDHLCFKRNDLGPDDKIRYILGLKGLIFIL